METATATATAPAKQTYIPGREYTYSADDLLIPEKGDPLYIEGRTNSNEGVDKLEASMKDQGWGNIPPILVIESQPGQLKVVAGIRRTKAARKTNTPAQIRVLDPGMPVTEQLSLNIEENENRTDTNAIAKAHSFQSFVTEYVKQVLTEEFPDATEYTAKAIAKATVQAKKVLGLRLKLTAQTVDEYLQLVNLIPAARKAVAEGTLTRTAVIDRGAGLTRMLKEDGTPDVEKQTAALEKLMKHSEAAGGKTVSRAAAKQAATTEAVGYKPSAWEIRQMTVNMEEAGEYAEQLALISFLRGDLTLRTAKKRLPWLKDVFVAKAGPGAAEE
jgi:hypothetical protein